MNTELFWEMNRDGRLEELAQNNPLEFEQLAEKIIEAAVRRPRSKNDSLRYFADIWTIKLLWEEADHTKWSSMTNNTGLAPVLEHRRQRILEAHIRLLKDSDRMKRAQKVQWRIDRERDKHDTALGACIALSNMLNERVWGENGLSDALNGLLTNEPATDDGTTSVQKCSVLPFKPSKK